jgi:hypothetical protein
MTVLNVSFPRAVGTAVNEDAIIAALEREPQGSSRDIARTLGAIPTEGPRK